MIRIAVVDDEKECVIKIKKYLQAMNRSDLEYYLYSDMCSLINEYDNGNVFDILFLDIEMDSLNGVDGARKIMEYTGKALIIFTTGYQQYVKEAFYLNAFQYMFKPIEFDDFSYELNRAIDAIKMRNTQYVINYNYEKVSLECSDILYIEKKNRHLVAKTKNKEYIFNGTIKEEERKLMGYGFAKTEQSCIVNLSHVKKFNQTTVELDNGDIKYLSKRMYKSFISAYNMYLSGCMI